MPVVLIFQLATLWLPIRAVWVSYELLQRRGVLRPPPVGLRDLYPVLGGSIPGARAGLPLVELGGSVHV